VSLRMLCILFGLALTLAAFVAVSVLRLVLTR
jgi:hypothetical protein